jgi:LysR family nitrogen assimilation transcriptional regulator
VKKSSKEPRARPTIPGGQAIIDSRRLLYFYHVARMGSFSAAEAILGIAQPALSRHIQQLEADLGVNLLERNGRGVSLTPFGTILHQQALAILGEMSNAVEKLQRARRNPRGRISIAAPAGIMANFMPDIIRRYVAALPEVQVTAIQASTGEVYDHLASGSVDVAIILQSRNTQKMSCQRIMVEELLVVARKDHPIAKQKFVQRSELPGLNLMLPGSRHGMRENIDRYCEEGGVELDSTLFLDSVPLQKALVLDGRGCIILPKLTCETDLDRSLFVAVPLKPVLTRSLYVASLQVRAKSPFVEALIREVIEVFRAKSKAGFPPSDDARRA